MGGAPVSVRGSPTDNGIRIAAAGNATGKDKSGAVTLTLDSDKTRTVKITVSQAKQEA